MMEEVWVVTVKYGYDFEVSRVGVGTGTKWGKQPNLRVRTTSASYNREFEGLANRFADLLTCGH